MRVRANVVATQHLLTYKAPLPTLLYFSTGPREASNAFPDIEALSAYKDGKSPQYWWRRRRTIGVGSVSTSPEVGPAGTVQTREA